MMPATPDIVLARLLKRQKINTLPYPEACPPPLHAYLAVARGSCQLPRPEPFLPAPWEPPATLLSAAPKMDSSQTPAELFQSPSNEIGTESQPHCNTHLCATSLLAECEKNQHKIPLEFPLCGTMPPAKHKQEKTSSSTAAVTAPNKIFLYRGLLLLQRFQNNGDFNLT